MKKIFFTLLFSAVVSLSFANSSVTITNGSIGGFENRITEDPTFVRKGEKLVIIDFSLPSTQKRLWVIDFATNSILYHTLVSHGKGTGNINAYSFSNEMHSNKSSLGFYVTGETYSGKHGLSLKLDGLQKHINDKARNRGIVIHGADYATESFIKKHGFLGRSLGCPAVPAHLHKEIINTIKEGNCLFIYHPSYH
jgi:hypothetical protein